MPLRKPNNGKKWATGTITATNTAPASSNIVVTGLSFTPSFVVVANSSNLIYLSKSSMRLYQDSSYYNSGAATRADGNARGLKQGPGYDDRMTTTGFQIMWENANNQSVTYYAYE